MRLDLYEVGKRFGERQALRDVTLSIPEFQSLAIVGPSGGGKTTLLRLIAGLTTPESGRLSINGQPIDYSEEALLAHRRGIGTVFQAYNLFPHLSARENVMLPLVKVHGLATLEARDVVDTLFERFHLSAHADQRGLLDWFGHFQPKPQLALVHGEDRAREALAGEIGERDGIEVVLVRPGMTLDA